MYISRNITKPKTAHGRELCKEFSPVGISLWWRNSNLDS